MPKNVEANTKITTNKEQPSSESIIQWPRLTFSPSTGDSNISSYIKGLEEAIAANFGVNYTSLIRTGKEWTPPIPKYTTVPNNHPDYLFYKDLRKSLINNYASELQRASTVNQKLYGIIWVTLSRESKYAIERLPEWTQVAAPPEEQPAEVAQDPVQPANDADEQPEEPERRPRRRRGGQGRGERAGRGRGRGRGRNQPAAVNENEDEDGGDGRGGGNENQLPPGPIIPNPPASELHPVYSMSTSVVHTLEQLWEAILRTHIIAPSGPRKASNDIFQATESYRSTKMDNKESLSSFKERFIFALKRVTIIGGTPEAEGIATTRFIKALDPARFAEFWKDLDTSVTMGGRSPPRTIEEAFQLAYDSLVKVNTTFRYSNVNESQVLLTDAKSKGKDKNNKGYKGSRPQHHPSNKHKNNDKDTKKNHNKGKEKNGKNNNNNNKSSKKGEQRGDVTCYFCGRLGHFQSDCLSYKAAQAFSKKRHEQNQDEAHGEGPRNRVSWGPPPDRDRGKTPQDGRGTDRSTSFVTNNRRFIDSDEEDEESSVLMTNEADEDHTGYVILDGASSTNIIKDRHLLTNIRPAPRPLSISGITDGPSIVTREIGDLPYFGVCYFDERASANVLCQAKIEDKFKIDYRQGKYFKVQVNEDIIVKFRRQGMKYVCPNFVFTKLTGDVNESTGETDEHAKVHSTSERNEFTEEQPERARKRKNPPVSVPDPPSVDQVLKPHPKRVLETLKLQRNMGYPALSSMRGYVSKGNILNIPITSKHVEEAIAATNGKTTEEMKGKAQPNRLSLPKTITTQVGSKLITLNIDVMFLNSHAFLITVSEPIYYTTSSYLRKRTWSDLGTELMRVISAYVGKGHLVTKVRSDNEGCVVASKQILELKGIEVDLTDPESHVFIVESKIRWIKERSRTILHSTHYEPPDAIIPWLPRFVVFCLNIVPKSRTGLIPREELTGLKVDAKRDIRACWGDIVELYKTPKIMNSMQERSVTCIALAPTGNSTGSWFFLSLATGMVIKGYRWEERKYDELALKSIIEINKKPRIDKETSQRSEESPSDLIIERPERFSKSEESTKDNEKEEPNQRTNQEAEEPKEKEIGEEKQENQEPSPRQRQLFENPENPISGFQPPVNRFGMAEFSASQRPLNIGVSDEADFEKVGSYYFNSLFPSESLCQTSCFNIKVSDALKKFPKLAEAAIRSKIDQMVQKKVFIPINLSEVPVGEKSSRIYSSMFLKEKFHPDGSLKKLKARLVAGGNMQDRSLYDENSISSPTASVPAVLIVSALGADQGQIITSIDFPGAYLNADIGEAIIYMTLDPNVSRIYCDLFPEAKRFLSKNGRITVRLLKALYGCLESGRLWFNNLVQALLEYGFVQNRKDPCIFNLFISSDVCLTVCLYVDDLLVVSPTECVLNDFISFLRHRYKDLTINRGKTHNYLGMNMEFGARCVRVSMDSHVKDVIQSYQSLFRRELPSRVPSSPSTADLFTVPEESSPLGGADRDAFHTVVAKILFIAKRVRPDVLAPVSFLSGRVRDPTESDQAKLERLITYIHHTSSAGIKLDVYGGGRPEVTAWVDSSFGTHLNGAGQTGYVVTLGGGPIMASSAKQKHVTTSSGECELAGLYDGSTGVIWTRDFLIEQGYKVGPARILHDNTSAITLAKKGFSSSKRSRHFHVKHLFIADRIKDGEIDLEYCEGKKMRADILTKGISGKGFSELARDMMNDR